MGDDLAGWYRRFQGERPTVSAEVLPRPAAVADLGELVAVVYRRRGGDLREHAFAAGSRPALARDESGALHVVGGAYRVGPKGIEDMQHTTHNGLALHDASRVRFTPRGVAVYGKAVPAEGLAVKRFNPIGEAVGAMRRGGEVIARGVAVGGIAWASGTVSDVLVERTPWSEGWRAVAQGVMLGAPGIVLAASSPTLSVGLLSGALVSAGGRFFRARQWDVRARNWLAGLMPARTAAGVRGGEGFDVRTEAAEMFG